MAPRLEQVTPEGAGRRRTRQRTYRAGLKQLGYGCPDRDDERAYEIDGEDPGDGIVIPGARERFNDTPYKARPDIPEFGGDGRVDAPGVRNRSALDSVDLSQIPARYRQDRVLFHAHASRLQQAQQGEEQHSQDGRSWREIAGGEVFPSNLAEARAPYGMPDSEPYRHAYRFVNDRPRTQPRLPDNEMIDGNFIMRPGRR